MSALDDLDWRLAVVGDGTARAACLSGLDSARLHYLGERDQAEVAALCAAADLFVWPAVNEAYGLALLEAQAAGLPVVAGRTGGVPDVVADGITGLLTPPQDASAFADAIRALLGDTGRRRAMAKAAAERTSKELDLIGASQSLARIITQVSG